MSNVFAIVHAFEMNLIHRGISALSRVEDISADGGDAQDASAVGDYFSADQPGAAMENFYVGHGVGFVQTFDRHAGLILSRISFTRSNHANRRAAVPSQLDLV